MLFVVTLFSCFAISIIMITGMGAQVYQNIVDSMTDSFNTRTSFSYIINKVHQNDFNGAISVGKYEGQDALIISEEIDNITYCTYMYAYDGYLKEIFIRKDQSFDPAYGNNILTIDDFNVSSISDSLIKFEVTPTNSSTKSLYVHTRTN